MNARRRQNDAFPILSALLLTFNSSKNDFCAGNFVPNEKVAPQFACANEEATY